MIAAGLSNINFEFGQIFLLDDSKISFPDEELVGQRKVHDFRPVLICQDNQYNTKPAFPTITIAPISRKGDYKTNLDYELLSKSEPVEENSYVRLYLLQPALKVNLTKCVGKITESSIEEIKAILYYYFGFI